jgi:hypothetical protein
MKTIINGTMVVGVDIHCIKYVWNLIHNPEKLAKIQTSIVLEEGKKDVENAFRKWMHEKNILDIGYDPNIPYDAQCVHTFDALLNNKYKYIYCPEFATEGMIARPSAIKNIGKGHIGLFLVHMCKEGDFNAEGKPKGEKAVKFMEDIAKLSYQRYVIQELGYIVDEAIIYYVNGDYTKEDRHAWSEFFISENVTELVVEYEFKTKLAIEKVKELMATKEEPSCPGLDVDKCIKIECPCLERCKDELKSSDSIAWKLTGLYKKNKCALVNAGFVTPTDIIKAHNSTFPVNLNEKQLRQMDFVIHPKKKPYISKDELEEFMTKTFDGVDTLVFFDFETYQYALPKFRDLKPYEQMPFQWSAHVLDIATGEVVHSEFLARKGQDPRRACAEKMLTLPSDANVRWVAYNMAFEKGVIRKLGEQFPDLQEDLDYIRDSFVDLMIPFRNQWIYTADMQGSYSVKYILPALFPNAESLNYHNLSDIQNGQDAQRGYLELQKKKGMDLQELKTNMLKYCCLDTWGLVMIFGFIRELMANGYKMKDYGEELIGSKFTLVS